MKEDVGWVSKGILEDLALVMTSGGLGKHDEGNRNKEGDKFSKANQ